ncbi:KAP family P-loop domain protein [Slackia heliotrinireducens DSM 20476]|uniref:KAP family P-loop domain protein n=2 Tax=Slackia TaxID=84108 RepID=C7N487_SLAHD|nr:KAP family P-loop domain protein [Slackia heliotrinireducens DSM 20476]
MQEAHMNTHSKSKRNDNLCGYPDAPSEKDLLGIQKYCNSLAEFISKCETPMTLSIQGDWGSGKTTALKLIAQALESRYHDLVPQIVWFNTWQYSALGLGDNLTLALMESLASKLGEMTPIEQDSVLGRIPEALRKVCKGATNGAAAVALSLVEANFGSVVLNSMSGAFLDQDSKESPSKVVENIKPSIAQSIKDAIGQNSGRRIVVLIDDLDRLNPRIAVELLEGIKNFLDFENCVFVLAVDDKVVYQGIESKYGKDFGKKKEFFDKIIQLPFVLPMGQYRIETYLEQEFGVDKARVGDYKKAITSVTPFRNNPRSIKRVFNLLQLYTIVAGDVIETERQRFFLFLILLIQMGERYRDENAADTVTKDGKTYDKTYNGLVNSAKNSKDASEFKKYMKHCYPDVLEIVSAKADGEDEDGLDEFINLVVQIGKLTNPVPAGEPADLTCPPWAEPLKAVFDAFVASDAYQVEAIADRINVSDESGSVVCSIRNKPSIDQGKSHMNIVIKPDANGVIALRELPREDALHGFGVRWDGGPADIMTICDITKNSDVAYLLETLRGFGFNI